MAQIFAQPSPEPAALPGLGDLGPPFRRPARPCRQGPAPSGSSWVAAASFWGGPLQQSHRPSRQITGPSGADRHGPPGIVKRCCRYQSKGIGIAIVAFAGQAGRHANWPGHNTTHRDKPGIEVINGFGAITAI